MVSPHFVQCDLFLLAGFLNRRLTIIDENSQ